MSVELNVSSTYFSMFDEDIRSGSEPPISLVTILPIILQFSLLNYNLKTYKLKET